MANAILFCITQNDDCKSVVIKDVTGAYSPINLGGWGTPNHALGTALTATITFEKRNTDGTFTTSPLSPVSVYSTLPSQTNGTVTITAEQAGYGTAAQFTDGVYRITYTVTGNDGGAYTLTSVHYEGFICQGECCWKKQADTVSLCLCDCTQIEKEFNKLSLYMRLYQSAKSCANLNEMQAYIDKIGKLCQGCGCGGGC